MKIECGYLSGWAKKWSHTQKSHPKWRTPDKQLGNTEEEEEVYLVICLSDKSKLIVRML